MYVMELSYCFCSTLGHQFCAPNCQVFWKYCANIFLYPIFITFKERLNQKLLKIELKCENWTRQVKDWLFNHIIEDNLSTHFCCYKKLSIKLPMTLTLSRGCLHSFIFIVGKRGIFTRSSWQWVFCPLSVSLPCCYCQIILNNASPEIN